MKNPPPGKEYMGVPADRMKPKAKAFSFKKFSDGNAKGAYKFKKSAGANSSAKRFGMDERAPKGRSPFPTSSFERRKSGR